MPLSQYNLLKRKLEANFKLDSDPDVAQLMVPVLPLQARGAEGGGPLGPGAAGLREAAPSGARLPAAGLRPPDPAPEPRPPAPPSARSAPFPEPPPRRSYGAGRG